MKISSAKRCSMNRWKKCNRNFGEKNFPQPVSGNFCGSGLGERNLIFLTVPTAAEKNGFYSHNSCTIKVTALTAAVVVGESKEIFVARTP